MATGSPPQTHPHNTPPPPRPQQSRSQPVTVRSLRILLPVTSLSLVFLGIGGWILWAGLRMQSAVLSQASQDLDLQTRLIASGVREPFERWEELEHDRDDDDDDDNKYTTQPIPQDPTLMRLVASAAENINGRVVLTDARQRVVYSSDDIVSTDNTLSSPEFSQPYAIRADQWTEEQRLFVATPLVATSGQIFGYVQLSIPMRRIYLQIAQLWSGLLLAGGVMLLVTALISLGMAHFILRPIQALTRSAGAIASGDLTQQVTPAGPEEIRHLAEAFNRMATQVGDMLARQRDFVAHAAHELRTPLTALSLRLEMIQAHGKDNASLTARYLKQMGDEFEHLRRLIDHLLALADLDAHEMPTLTALDLAPLLYRLADDMGPLIQAAGHTLQVDVPPHLPPVFVNADQMQAVVRNVLDNAIKYTPANGTIILSATATPREVHISVADTGSGIPPEFLERIFDRFYRIDKARSRKLGGSGLGLSLVKDIVEAYGGRIEVHSQVGQGSRFTLHLPSGATQTH